MRSSRNTVDLDVNFGQSPVETCVARLPLMPLGAGTRHFPWRETGQTRYARLYGRLASTMLISFDLDDTLICYDPQVPREPIRAPLWKRFQEQEPLRFGAVDLARQLQNEGHELMIYTTSLRKPSQVKRWLGFYGFHASEVINADLHARKVGEMARQFSKMPSHFGVSLHVDDEDFCEMGKRFGFKWLMVAPHDLDWANKVLAAAHDIEEQKR